MSVVTENAKSLAKRFANPAFNLATTNAIIRNAQSYAQKYVIDSLVISHACKNYPVNIFVLVCVEKNAQNFANFVSLSMKF